jgi:hypothetical protein
MPVIVVTRLRLRDPALLTAFFTAGAAVLRQAKKADGNLGADALGDAKQRGTMNAVTSGDPGAADLLARSRLDDDGAPPAVPRQPKPATGRTEFMTCTDPAATGIIDALDSFYCYNMG